MISARFIFLHFSAPSAWSPLTLCGDINTKNGKFVMNEKIWVSVDIINNIQTFYLVFESDWRSQLKLPCESGNCLSGLIETSRDVEH